MIFLYILVFLILFSLFLGFYSVLTTLHRQKVQEPAPRYLISYVNDIERAKTKLLADGLLDLWQYSGKYKLHAQYLETPGSKKVVILLHGIRGRGQDRFLEADFYRRLGYSLLFPDDRGHGGSEGNWYGMGQYERKDLLIWFDWLREHIGSDVQIILDGWSMGSASALLISCDGKAENLVATIADCGFSSARDECCFLIRKDHFPAWFVYPSMVLATRLFAGYNLNDADPSAVLPDCRVPVFFLHGESDSYVPTQMSRKMYELCPTGKELYLVPEARHVASRVTDRKGCEQAIEAFLAKYVKD